MGIDELLFTDEAVCPYKVEKKGKVSFSIHINRNNTIDASVLQTIQNNLNYIKRYGEVNKNKQCNLHMTLFAPNFKDKTVILILEMLLFSLLDKIDIQLYLNIKLSAKDAIEYNFFRFSYLFKVNRTFIKSFDYCKNFLLYSGCGYVLSKNTPDIVAANFRKCFFIDEYKESSIYMINQQFLSNDIFSTLKNVLKDEKILNDTCSIIDELVDNILCHTTSGIGVVDIGVMKVASKKDDGIYHQFMINVINISEECLYTEIKKSFKDESIDLHSRGMIEQAYRSQLNLFDGNSYSENLFFMVSAFQKGTTTREKSRRGGTGLNKSIISFSEKAQNDIPDGQSYVYSGQDILLFNHEILSNSSIGNNIAFNIKNDYNMPPDEKCISKSVYFLNGTAYNLMYIVKENDYGK